MQHRFSRLAGIAFLLAYAPATAGADGWSGVVNAWAAYANESCEQAETVIAKCRRCGDPVARAHIELLRAFCRERAGKEDASSFYQDLATRYPHTEIAEHALLRAVTIAREKPETPSAEAQPNSMESMPRFRAQAFYPEHLRRAKVSGWVLLGFDVRPDGRVADAHVIESSPPYVFDLAAVNSLMRWYYPPHAREGLMVKLTFAMEP